MEGRGDEAAPDAFWRGRFALLQPRGRGHRAGLDPLLLACALPDWLAGWAADLGAGAGALGFAAACRCSGLSVRMAEIEGEMAALARASLDLAENEALRGRLEVAEGDVLAGRKAREAMGLGDSAFDAVITNPPFHPAGGRVSPDALRAAAKSVPDAAFLPEWVRVSASLLKHGGVFACVARPDAIRQLLEGAEGRLGGIELVPVHPRPDRPAVRLLMLARRGSRAPLALRPAVVLQDAAGAPTPTGEAVAAGAPLFGPGAA
jgi:tRNA1(Val) A37 N6-methylase TrmN6